MNNLIPPNLVYLTIYNPSLQSTGPETEEDEDAEEQAHILFYTSKERAVSRDRMLRQVGLAKALVSFAEMFNDQSPLDTVHSQTRRMIMVSPEPHFWIHACVELAKAPRKLQGKGKSKSREKVKVKEREKGKDTGCEGLVYDYLDGSVHDGALREDMLRGYERFKLMNGAFTEILNTLGQEALALQLERFWTPWAWSWSIEDGQEFGRHLGISLHPYFQAILPALDELQDYLSQQDDEDNDLTPSLLLLSRTSIVPSTTYLQKDLPISLPLFLSSLIPPPRDPSTHSQDDLLASSQATIKAPLDQGTNKGDGDGSSSGGTAGFLNMDVRKWNWSGVLTFGRSSNSGKTSPKSKGVSGQNTTAASSRRGSIDEQSASRSQISSLSSSGGDKVGKGGERNDDVDNDVNGDGVSVGASESESEGDRDQDKSESDTRSVVEVSVDESALYDAITSKVSPAPSMKENSGSSMTESSVSSSTNTQERALPDSPGDERSKDETQESVEEEEEGGEEEERKTIKEPEIVTPRALPAFLRKIVYLQDGDDPLVTSQRGVYFMLKAQWMLALIRNHSVSEENRIQQYLDRVSGKSERFFSMIEEIVQEEAIKSMTDSLPSATKILQPLDIYIGTSGKYTSGSESFHSKSGILHEAKALQARDPEIFEVFSRGQNPQHWHMARRTATRVVSSPLKSQQQGGSGGAGSVGEQPLEMYMEVFRKETSLADVDNVMAGVVKNWKGC